MGPVLPGAFLGSSSSLTRAQDHVKPHDAIENAFARVGYGPGCNLAIDQIEHMFYPTVMTRPAYMEIPCKTALNRVSGMPFRWSLNPYRGCVHGCHYCYARASHSFLGMNADEDFETKIVVKTNMPEVLQQELRKPSWTGERVAIGTATDAYQPCEGRYALTRRCLEALSDAGTPISIVTKSTLILRDQDLLMELAQTAGVTVYFTITTLDHEHWRLIEPGTPPPHKRLEVLGRLSQAGVPT
jgi:DNA repair photolyase